MHFPEQERAWTIPLEDPLRNAELLVPVKIQGRGPFLFVLSPDASASTIDRGLAQELGLYTPPDSWRSLVDSRDREVRRRPYEILRLTAGDLRIRNFIAYGAPSGSLEVAGRRVHGILGGNLLTRTVTIEIDRDQGIARLAITGHAQKPREAVLIEGRVHKIAGGPPRKLVVPASLAGEKVELAVDLAARHSAVRPEKLRRAARTVAAEPTDWLDSLGTRRRVDWRASARLSLAKGAGARLPLLPFEDRRVREFWDFDGVVGQDLLSRYRVVYHPDRRKLWLAPRKATLAAGIRARLNRWERIARCSSAGCVSVRLEDGSLLLSLDAAAPAMLDVVLQPVAASGRSLDGAPLLRVAAREVTHLDVAGIPGWRQAAAARVVDASPISRGCRGRCYELYPAYPPEDPQGAPGDAARTTACYLPLSR